MRFMWDFNNKLFISYATVMKKGTRLGEAEERVMDSLQHKQCIQKIIMLSCSLCDITYQLQ